MCYKLPYRELKFDNNVLKYTIDYIVSLDTYGSYCCMFVVDMLYSSKLHDRDDEFPILCDKSIPPNNKAKKLMSTFYDKKNYTISLYMLKYCLEKGLKVKKIHHVIYAEQSDFMKSYIVFNNEKRTECSINKDKFGVDRCKLMNNANFRKQIENVRKYKDTRIANNADKAKKLVFKVTLNNWHILSESVTLYQMKKSSVLLDKPIIIRFMILEIEKLEMSVHYNRLKIIFSDNMQFLYTDTDSFKLFIKNTNPYELRKHGLEHFTDTSNFSTDTIFPLKAGKNEKCFGCLKFENGQCPTKEFNSKAAKTYEEKRINQLRSVEAKGLTRGFKINISDNNFKNVTLDEKPLRATQKQMESKNLNMAMEDVEKDVIPVY